MLRYVRQASQEQSSEQPSVATLEQSLAVQFAQLVFLHSCPLAIISYLRRRFSASTGSEGDVAGGETPLQYMPS
jgi:hypothetical protein